MKKIYSFMLLAAAMLLSVNANAAFADAAALQNALNDAEDGATVQLNGNLSISGSSNPIIALNLGSKTVTLDLTGDTISFSGTAAKDMFHISQGTLIVKNGVIRHTGSTSGTPTIFKLFGTGEDILAGEFTHLTIEEDVKLFVADGGSGKKGYGISINECAASTVNTVALANGIRVDVKGYISMMSAKGYCVKVNGTIKYAPRYFTTKLGIANPTTADTLHWEACAPHVYLHSTSQLIANANSTGVGAIYASGYAVWDIRGHAEGSCALAVKSGNVTVTDAVLESTAPQYSDAKATGNSGLDTQGSAVLIESNTSYPGQIQVTFAGDTEIKSSVGYAVEEAVTRGDNTQVSAISIEGGSFEGGQKGCITIDSKTLNNEQTQITIGGGSYTAQDQYQQDKTQALLEKLLGNNTADPEYTIAISNGTSTGTGMSLVISPTVIPSPIANPDFDIEALEDLVESGGDINLAKVEVEGGILTLDKNLEMENLFMNCEQPLSIVIPNGFTLTAKRIVMGENDNITIQAGGKLVVTGDQGVYAVNVNNLIIEAEEGNMGIFLFKPSVAANRHPHATVQLISKAHQEGNKFVWQRFGIPAYHGFKKATIQRVGHSYNRAYRWWNPAINDWDVIATDQIMTPFTGFTMTSDAPAAGTKYAMPCDSLYGNVNAIVKHLPGWNYFANSYTGKIDVAAFLSGILNADYEYQLAHGEGEHLIEEGVHVNTSSESNNWVAISEYDVKDGLPDSLKTLAPMQAFVTKLLIAEDYKDTLNYEAMVWNPAMGISNNAPARRNMMASDYTKAVVEIANGENVQMVTLRQGSQFSNEFDNGAEVSAFKAGEVSMYATTEYGEMAQIASDNLIGQTLTIESAKAATFKMTFKGLKGETLAIRDNFTGSVINMTEGAEYYFSVAPNTTEARFEIVEAAKMPTDVETLEAAPAKKGIYSLQGQYLGENFHVLPAGIYVVNGVKVVK